MHSATVKKILTCLALALAATNASASSQLDDVRVTQINFKPDDNYIFVHARDTQGNDNVFWIYNKDVTTLISCPAAEAENNKLKALELALKYSLRVNVQLKTPASVRPPGYENQYVDAVMVQSIEQPFESTAPPVGPGNSVSGQAVGLKITSFNIYPGIYIQDASGQVYSLSLSTQLCTPESRHLHELAFNALEHAMSVKASMEPGPDFSRDIDLLP